MLRLFLYFVINVLFLDFSYANNIAQNIAVVDFARIRKESKLGKSIDQQAKDMMDEFNRQMSALEKQLKQEQAENHAKKLSTREEYSESVHNFEKKQDSFVQLSRKLRNISKNAIENAEQQFRAVLLSVMEEKFTNLQTSVVFEKSQLLFYKNIKDITDEVLDLMNNSDKTININVEEINAGF